MKILRVSLFVLATLATGAWAVLYVLITSVACAYVTGGCSLKMPWQLDGESLTYLFLIPGVVVLGLWVAALKIGRER